MSEIKIEIIEEAGAHTLLEAPHWDAPSQSLYFTEIMEFAIFRLDYQENKVYKAFIGMKMLLFTF